MVYYLLLGFNLAFVKATQCNLLSNRALCSHMWRLTVGHHVWAIEWCSRRKKKLSPSMCWVEVYGYSPWSPASWTRRAATVTNPPNSVKNSSYFKSSLLNIVVKCWFLMTSKSFTVQHSSSTCCSWFWQLKLWLWVSSAHRRSYPLPKVTYRAIDRGNILHIHSHWTLKLILNLLF